MKTEFNYYKDIEIKKTLKPKTINIDIYKCKVQILFGKEAIKLEKDWKKTTKGFGGLTRNFLKTSGDVLISFPNENPKLEYVVHEFHHAVDMIMDDIGHKRNNDGDEPSAYLMGYLIKEYKKIKTPN